MTSSSFMFVQLLTVATTSCQASSETALSPSSYFEACTDFLSKLFFLRFEDAIWDGFAEAFLALTVFGIVSALLSVHRRCTHKNHPPRAKVLSSHEDVPRAKATKAVRDRSSSPSGCVDSKASSRKPSVPSWTARSGLETEMDALVRVVREGKASKLPELLDAALERSLDAARPASEDICSQLLLSSLRACCASRCFGEGLAAYEHMAGRIGKGSGPLWSVLLYCIVEAKAFHHSKYVLEKICSQSGLSDNDFVNMVHCFASQCDPAGLQERLGHLKSCGHSVDAYTWNRALAACGTAACPMSFVDDLVAAGICNEVTDAVGYNTLMKHNGRAGNISKCFELRAQMSAQGIKPSQVTFGVLLDACVYAQELERAKEVFSELCSSGLQLNVVHCTTFMQVLVGASLLDEAAAVLHQMIQSPGVQPDRIAFSIILKAYASNGNVSAALKILELMLEEGVSPDRYTFDGVLNGCCSFPMKSAEVMRTFETLIGHGMKPTTTTLSILLKALAKTLAWDTSLLVLKDSPKRFGLEPEDRLYAQLAQACLRARESSRKVLEVFQLMLQAAQRQGKVVDKKAAGQLLQACLLGGSHEVAKELREMMQHSGIAIDTHMDNMFKAALARKDGVLLWRDIHALRTDGRRPARRSAVANVL